MANMVELWGTDEPLAPTNDFFDRLGRMNSVYELLPPHMQPAISKSGPKFGKTSAVVATATVASVVGPTTLDVVTGTPSAYAQELEQGQELRPDKPRLVAIMDSLGEGTEAHGGEQLIEDLGVDVTVYDALGGRQYILEGCEDGDCPVMFGEPAIDGKRAIEQHRDAIADADVAFIPLGANGFLDSAYDWTVQMGRQIHGISNQDGRPATVVFTELYGESRYVDADRMNPEIRRAVQKLNSDGIPAEILPMQAFVDDHIRPQGGVAADEVHLDWGAKGYGALAKKQAELLAPIAHDQFNRNYPELTAPQQPASPADSTVPVLSPGPADLPGGTFTPAPSAVAEIVPVNIDMTATAPVPIQPPQSQAEPGVLFASIDMSLGGSKGSEYETATPATVVPETVLGAQPPAMIDVLTQMPTTTSTTTIPISVPEIGVPPAVSPAVELPAGLELGPDETGTDTDTEVQFASVDMSLSADLLVPDSPEPVDTPVPPSTTTVPAPPPKSREDTDPVQPEPGQMVPLLPIIDEAKKQQDITDLFVTPDPVLVDPLSVAEAEPATEPITPAEPVIVPEQANVAEYVSLATANDIFYDPQTGQARTYLGDFVDRDELPVLEVSEPFGDLRDLGNGSFRQGNVDFRTDRRNTQLLSPAAGVVEMTTNQAEGNKVIIRLGTDPATGKPWRWYATHLSEFHVQPGDVVMPGDVLGRSGQTGQTQGVHNSIGITSHETDPNEYINYQEAMGQHIFDYSPGLDYVGTDLEDEYELDGPTVPGVYHSLPLAPEVLEALGIPEYIDPSLIDANGQPITPAITEPPQAEPAGPTGFVDVDLSPEVAVDPEVIIDEGKKADTDSALVDVIVDDGVDDIVEEESGEEEVEIEPPADDVSDVLPTIDPDKKADKSDLELDDVPADAEQVEDDLEVVDGVVDPPGELDEGEPSTDGLEDGSPENTEAEEGSGDQPGATSEEAVVPPVTHQDIVAQDNLAFMPAGWKEVFEAAQAQPENAEIEAQTVAAALWIENRHFPDIGQEWPVSSAGAAGPMQIIDSTWELIARDGDGDGRMDRNNPWDAVFGAFQHMPGSKGDPIVNEGLTGDPTIDIHTAVFERRTETQLSRIAMYNGDGRTVDRASMAELSQTRRQNNDYIRMGAALLLTDLRFGIVLDREGPGFHWVDASDGLTPVSEEHVRATILGISADGADTAGEAEG